MSRSAAAVAIVLGTATPVAAETFQIGAFGDSITQGSCCPESPYSYLVKLNSLLAGWCPPDTCTIDNHGLASEETPAGLTRLQNSLIPNNPGSDLFLTMHGTNDIFTNKSVPTIQFNLEKMDEALALAGIDNVVTPVIGFHPWVMNVNRPAGCSGTVKNWVDGASQNLRNTLQTVAANLNRYFADQWSELCPQSGNDRHGHTENQCFGLSVDPAAPGRFLPWDATTMAEHYGEGCIVGHPNISGFDMLADRFFETITQRPKPGGVSGLSPASGVGVCGAPTFSWTKEAGEHATFYELDIDSGGFRQWRQEVDGRPMQPDLCAFDSDPDNVCSWADPAGLGVGTHTWRVRGRNPGGFGPWSATRTFQVFSGAPGATTGTYPANETFDTTPTYRWTRMANVFEYDLEVHDGTSWMGAGTYPDTGCGTGICEATPGAPVLTPGARKFRVRTRNTCGDGPLSSEVSFEVLDCAAFPDPPPLQNATVTTPETIRACAKITAGNLGAGDYVITGAGANVLFFAGGEVELRDGFTVGPDATFTAKVDY